jgi:hypothetical protein
MTQSKDRSSRTSPANDKDAKVTAPADRELNKTELESVAGGKSASHHALKK